MTVRGAWVAAAAMLAVAAGAPPARAAEADFTLCASCHGMGGVSYNVDTPSLAGQQSFYAITQLFLFRAGRRTNAAMTEVAKPMSDADLRAYSELIGRLPPAAPAPGVAADPARMKRGAVLAEQYRCTTCHGADLAGARQVPRLAGQREDYLARALAEFRSGARVGYTPAMNETLAGLGAAELGDLAHYMAHVSTLTGVAPAAPAASR
jgi:cytochrome c553